MIKKLILIGLVIVNSGAFANIYSNYQQDQYQREMLRQQQEQTRIMQQQAYQQQQAIADQQMYNDNLSRDRDFGGNNFGSTRPWNTR